MKAEIDKQAEALFQGRRPDSSLCWPVCLLGQLKIVQVSTIEANRCRWDECSAAVVAAGMNAVSGLCNRACKPLTYTQSFPEMSLNLSLVHLCLNSSRQSF